MRVTQSTRPRRPSASEALRGTLAAAWTSVSTSRLFSSGMISCRAARWSHDRLVRQVAELHVADELVHARASYLSIFSRHCSGSPTTIMSASLNRLGSKSPVVCAEEREDLVLLLGAQVGELPLERNSARFLYHHHTESQMPLASACSIESAQCTRV